MGAIGNKLLLILSIAINIFLSFVCLSGNGLQKYAPNYDSYEHEFMPPSSPRIYTKPARVASVTTPAATTTAAATDNGFRDNRFAAALASTTNIVELNPPDLHETATVMAMATGYKIRVFRMFVGSLRQTGYGGNIILVVSPDIPKLEEDYLREQGVTMHKVEYVDCTHGIDSNKPEVGVCVHPYPKLKHRWARFPVLRDLLRDCGGKVNPETTCGGPVLVSDLRDTFFQRNPFGPEAPRVRGLQLFKEHFTMTTNHWLAKSPIMECKNASYGDSPMICSGTTIGTRKAMLDYLDIFEEEMYRWMADPNCHFKINGDDQSMHNYMYYSGMLDGVAGGVVSIPNRMGLVNTVGGIGALIWKAENKKEELLGELLLAKNETDDGEETKDPPAAETKPEAARSRTLKAKSEDNSRNWIGMEYGVTDSDGYLVQFDGSRSYVVHQWDRYGGTIKEWLRENSEEIYGFDDRTNDYSPPYQSLDPKAKAKNAANTKTKEEKKISRRQRKKEMERKKAEKN